MDQRAIKILGISGSLRVQSTNSRLLKAFEQMLPQHAQYEVYNGLADLPHFNPDLDGSDTPVHAAVQNDENRSLRPMLP